MKRSITCALAALLLIGGVGAAQAESGSKADNKYATAKGPYAQLGFAIVKTNFDALDARLGFAIDGGYRFNDWLGADIDFVFAAREQNGIKGRNVAFTINGKFYPIGLLSPDTLDALQPYVVLGMGGGSSFVKDGGSTGTFIFRIGAGTEYFITDHFTAYMDLSLHATPGYEFAGSGGATGVIQFGVGYHF
jgi:opacity protein-like surface antigen